MTDVQPRHRPPRHQSALSPRRWYPGMVCSICGTHVTRWQRFNWDHIIPMSLGGKRGRSNKAFAHVLCNLVKGCRYPFSLRTSEERRQVHERVTPQTWLRLCAIWAGEAD